MCIPIAGTASTMWCIQERLEPQTFRASCRAPSSTCWMPTFNGFRQIELSSGFRVAHFNSFRTKRPIPFNGGGSPCPCSSIVPRSVWVAKAVNPRIDGTTRQETFRCPSVRRASATAFEANCRKLLLIGTDRGRLTHPFVQRELANRGQVVIVHAKSKSLMDRRAMPSDAMEEWLASDNWAVIHFNWGLWVDIVLGLRGVTTAKTRVSD